MRCPYFLESQVSVEQSLTSVKEKTEKEAEPGKVQSPQWADEVVVLKKLAC